ncbi:MULTISPECIES: NADH-quinone oxidoreductase subunit A [Arcanobacterium]|uniref:NADH-quinone oxidoreductase subunit A n=1 Tax=Arcanobacterium bovis TaxID=2529275 RepID=A0A4Q9UZX6_9ACTO|nr:MULTISPECIES: NADH-quinone oxidoreductase subunit A [Arcanobacterium]MBM7825895.1 NADH-quinone oxidoreductase subunit A [Arcanobacterium pluranimalium]TBW21522.1 NADH-quinone oxidoreductase subunit A [Arcanobacterium bovis]
MNPYVPLLVMIIASAVIAFGGLAASAILGPKKYNRVKVLNYECGVEATPNAGSAGRFPIKYFLTAMTFIIFDIEVVFLYPWAVSHEELGLFGLIAMASFVFLITVPFIYEWRRGGLEWSE